MTGEDRSVSGLSKKVTAFAGEIPVRPAWSSWLMSKFDELLHIAWSRKRREKSKALERPIIPLCQTHQLSVFGLPSKYSPTENLVCMDLLVSQRCTNSTAMPLTSSTR